MRATTHPRQAERLATLRSYDILDTPRETDFDDIAQLVSRICGTPIAVVNLIDAERQWFKAEVGLGVRETPLETSICSHVILEQDFTMIEDTHEDPRTADNELCAPLDGLRFYAGALLTADNGLPIGTLCVLDTEPNSLSEDQKSALKLLARRVMRELDLRRALKAQSVLRDEIDHRVKNSLATVAGAINLYRREAQQTGDADSAFAAIRRQLDAVAAIHQALYTSEDKGHVELGAYFRDLTDKLDASLPPSVSLTATAPSIAVPAEIANTIGLIANEFAANTLKHGMQTRSAARVTYDILYEDESIVLTFGNDLPERKRSDDDAPGIGSRLMAASVARYGGVVSQTGSREGFQLVATLPFRLSDATD